MNDNNADSIITLKTNSIFDERENGRSHAPYEIETSFFSCIGNGDINAVKKTMAAILDQKVIVGKMSNDEVRQMKYWAVSCITLATRYAVCGGLDETEAYNLADECIQNVDLMTDKNEIFIYLKKMCIELTKKVSESRENATYPYPVRKCLHYINTNLHEKLSVTLLAEECSLSADYLSLLFKNAVGITISKYIRLSRLNAAKDLLQKKYTTSEVAYYLGFCSESYFIKCFKDQFGITPKKYINNK